MWAVHIIEYYSAIKNNEILMHDMDGLFTCKVKEVRYKRSCMIQLHLYKMSTTGKPREIESRLVFARA